MTGHRSSAETRRLAGLDELTDSISSVKNEVINKVRALDARVRIKSTDYFNNTFVPDLVLNWPGEERSRELFIRADTNPEHLAEDIGLVPDREPIFFGLGSVSASANHNSPVSSEARDHGALVTDSAGTNEFLDRRRRTDLMGLASAAVLQGGRGVVDRTEASDTATLFEEGFESAKRGDSQGTASAASRIPGVLDPDRTDRLMQVLQALWVGSGQPASNFPATIRQRQLDSSALLFLLEQDWIRDRLFWRNLALSFTFDQLVALDLPEPTQNLQELIWANADRLKAGACSASTAEDSDIPDDRTTYWNIVDGALVFRTRHSILHLYGSASQLPDTIKSSGVALPGVLLRLTLLRKDGIPVRKIEFIEEGRKWTCEAEGQDGIFSEDDFTRLMATARRNARVRRVAVRTADGNFAKLNFVDRSITGYGSSRFAISEIVPLAFLGFPEFKAEEATAVSNTFTSLERPGHRPEVMHVTQLSEEIAREIDRW